MTETNLTTDTLRCIATDASFLAGIDVATDSHAAESLVVALDGRAIATLRIVDGVFLVVESDETGDGALIAFGEGTARSVAACLADTIMKESLRGASVPWGVDAADEDWRELQYPPMRVEF